MSYTFNPFTGNFDDIGSGGGGGGGDITAVTAGTGLSGGGTSGDVTLNLANTAVTPASYTYASITVDAQGRITSASSGTTPVTAAAGSNTQIQFNDTGAFAGDSGLTFNKTTNLLTVGASTADGGQAKVFGDINLDDGGSFTTTIQCVTPLANRTISFPDATGTVALVAGSSGQLLWNNAGANAGASTLTYDGSILTTSGRFINSYNSGSLAPAKAFTGTWATGAGTTNTKPHVLIETTGATSNNWSNSGTGLGVNAASGFAGNLLDLQVNGTSRVVVSATGNINLDPNGTKGIRIPASGAIDVRDSGFYFTVPTSGISKSSGLVCISSEISESLGIGGTGTRLATDGFGVLAQRNGTSAQVFRVYNTYTSGTNYELGKLEWSSNVFRIGTEKGSGGGTARAVEVHTDSVSRLALDTTGSVRVVTGLTVATLPGTPAVGMIARVTNATAPVVGSAVTGGGSAAALVWYNGTNWTVIGV